MIELRYNTAGQEIPLGYFLDSIDQDTEENGLTINNTDIQIWKWGTTSLVSKNSGGATFIQNGIYYCVLDATDTNTLGPMKIFLHSQGVYQAMVVECAVVDQNYWDSKYGTDNLQVDTVEISGDSVAADNLEATYDGTGYQDPVAPAQQQQVDNISIGSSGISVVAESVTITTGTPTGSYTETHQRDGNYHQIADVAGTTELYYQFDIGATGVPSSVTFYGRVYNFNDTINIYGWNWGASSWEQVGSVVGKNTTGDDELTFSLLTTHVGTGVNAGKVRVRFEGSSLTSSILYTDQLYVSYAVVASPVGYANGAIWVDTLSGTPGTVEGVNGVADNPVSNWSDAITLSGSTGLKIFEIANGSSIILTGDSDYFTLRGANWSLDLNGQSIANASITGAEVFGSSSGADYEMFNCKLGNGVPTPVTAAAGFFIKCAIAVGFVGNSAGTYYFDSCFSGVAGIATPYLDFGVGVGDINVNIRHYSGGIEIRNMGETGSDTMSLEGWGQYVIASSCISGTLAIRGHFKKTDYSGNSITISDDANFKTSVVHFGIAQGPGTGSNQIQLSSTASAQDGSYDPSMILIVSGTGEGQSRLIYQYDGTTKTATVDRNWKITPDATSEYRIMAHPGREHVNEGLAQGGTSNTITLNLLASSYDDAYNNQVVFIRSGNGEDQVRIITDYDGTTKIATVNNAWDIVPDSTTGYVILPVSTDKTGYSLSAAGIDAIWDEIHEDTLTARQMMRIILSVLAGKTTGGGTSSYTARDIADSKARVSISVDANKNRIASTLDGT